MSQNQRRFALSSVLIACCGLAYWVSVASAKEESSVLVKKGVAPPVAAPKLLPPANTASETLPPPSNPAVKQAPRQLNSAAPKRPFMRASESTRRVPATTALAVKDEPMPAPVDPGMQPETVAGPEFEVHHVANIEYDTDHDARKMYRRSGEVRVMMLAKNPADGCVYEIPMCIPGCCIGEPRVSGDRGLLGRGVVEFCWECGFRAEVKFRRVLGDVKVEYEGD